MDELLINEAVTNAHVSGNTAWMLASTALVLFMTPGLAFFYGGMVRAKHVLGMLMQNFFCMGMASLVWALVGYSIAFGPSTSGFWGGFGFAALQDIGDPFVVPYTAEGGLTPTVVFIAFQMMFAIITPALITGAVADRFKFWAFAIFVTLWLLFVYAPIAHWVWDTDGWLYRRGALDFAGGTVVHANAGIAGVVLAYVLGRRRGWPGADFRPHNVPFVLLGASVLWFGWFGFNAGSALGSGTLAGWAFLNTQLATAAALLGWIGAEWVRDGKPTTLGAASGAVAGLVAITPACGFVSAMGAMAIGALAGVLCALATAIKGKVGIDDALDVGAVHLVGGVLGALLVGFFATTDTGGTTLDGVFYGGSGQLLLDQLVAVAATIGYSAVCTAILGLIVVRVLNGRISARDEEVGLDESQHGESSYRFHFAGGTGSVFAASRVKGTREAQA